MSVQSIVRLIARATVNSRDWDAFKQLVAATKTIVETEGPDRVLTHECYYQSGSFDCLIVEAYANEEAFLTHLELVKPLSAKYRVDWRLTRLELLGPYSAAVVEAMIKGNAEAEVVHYDRSLRKGK